VDAELRTLLLVNNRLAVRDCAEPLLVWAANRPVARHLQHFNEMMLARGRVAGPNSLRIPLGDMTATIGGRSIRCELDTVMGPPASRSTPDRCRESALNLNNAKGPAGSSAQAAVRESTYSVVVGSCRRSDEGLRLTFT